MTSPQGSTTTHEGRTYSVAGRTLPSVSTVTKRLANKAIEVHDQKRIAHAVAVDRHVRALAEADPYKAVRMALDTAPSLEADLGTDVHEATELYDKHGTSLTTVPFVQPFLDQWIDARVEYGMTCVVIEQTVANLELGYAGSLDRIATLIAPDGAPDHWNGGLWACDKDCQSPNHVVDIKTGKDVYPDTALQLAAYANAPEFWTAGEEYGTGELTEALPVCRIMGLVAHLHADSFALFPLYLPDGWEAYKGALKVQAWEEVKSHVRGDPLPRRIAKGFPW
jgi:hypothetical protein